jgi:hypothetical protein
MTQDGIRYEKLVEDALRGVVRAALEEVADHGLPGAHHFYITFRTDAPGVEIPDYLHEKYPSEMTVVMQYQFWDLLVEEDFFSITLSFNNVGENMVIPFAAITGFADPSVKFGLQFHTPESEAAEEDPPVSKKKKPPTAASISAVSDDDSSGGDNVVTLDKFRKK